MSHSAFRLRSLWAALALAPLLAACSTPDQSSCPHAEVVGDLARLVKFSGVGTEPADIAYTAHIADVQAGCRFDEGNITVDMSVGLVAERGPAGAGLEGGPVTYFVAIIDGQNNILAKRSFDDRLLFDSQGLARMTDDLQQHLSISADRSASDHSILIGFQLTPEQVQLNQSQPEK